MRNPISKETRKKIRKDEKEFKKAEKEGRIYYDSVHCVVWILDKEDNVWKKTTDFFNQ